MEKRLALSAGLAGLAILPTAMFYDVLFAVHGPVLGALNGDLALQFLPWREFGFSELAKANLALWNPHIYSGAPFFGGMKSALLYPPNWLYLVLPLALATNWTIALHVWMIGAFMFLWGLRRGLHSFAALMLRLKYLVERWTPSCAKARISWRSPPISPRLPYCSSPTPGRPDGGRGRLRRAMKSCRPITHCAIALNRGRHHFRVVYAPLAFRIGAVVSGAAWLAWMLAFYVLRRRTLGMTHA